MATISVEMAVERWNEAIRQKTVLPIDGLPDVMTQHADTLAKIDAQPFVASEKQKRRDAANAEMRTKVNQLVEAACDSILPAEAPTPAPAPAVARRMLAA